MINWRMKYDGFAQYKRIIEALQYVDITYDHAATSFTRHEGIFLFTCDEETMEILKKAKYNK